MWRWAIVLAACSYQATEAEPEIVHHATIASPPTLPSAITAIHSRPIGIVAITEDGESAASVDLDGAIRVWPTLDGTREPFVVPAAPAMQLAVARQGDFAVAVVDQVGSLEIVRITMAGQPRARTQVDGEPGVIAVFATNAGFLVERADQVIELVTLDGARAGRLSGPHRIASMLYRRGRALVLFEGGGGRWIDLVGGLRWGGDTPALAIDPKRAALSPDHRHLAALTTERELVVVDLVTGVPGPKIQGGGEPLGYTDVDEIVCGNNYATTFWHEDGAQIVRGAPGYSTESDPFAVGDHRVVAGENASLRLFDRAGVRHLGYAFGEMRQLWSPGTTVTAMLPSHVWIVDAAPHGGRLVQSKNPSFDVLDLAAVDDRTTLALIQIKDKRAIAFTDGKPLFFVGDSNANVHYEPSTHLVAVTERGETILVRVAHGHAGVPMRLPTAAATEEYNADRVFLLDPALAHGLVAIVLHDDQVLEIHEADLDVHLHARRAYRRPGQVLAVDRAGRIYTRSAHAILVYGGTSPVTLHGLDSQRAIVPNNDGTLVAVLADSNLSLFGRDGSLKWTVPANETRQLAWEGDELIGNGHGLVRYDLVTGAIADRMCGSGFGVFESAPAVVTLGRPTCDAP